MKYKTSNRKEKNYKKWYFLTSGIMLKGEMAESKKNQKAKLPVWCLVMCELKT